jgi:HlyD family secretion protein
VKKKIVVAALVVSVAVLAGAGLWLAQRKSGSSDSLLLYGNVDIREVALAFNGSERIVELAAREGDRVSAGQELGRLDTRALVLRADQARAQIGVQEQALLRLRNGSRPQEVAQARASVQAARAEADLARQQLARLMTTSRNSGGRAVSREEIDVAQARVHTTEAQLASMRESAGLVVAGARPEDIAQAQAQLAAVRADLALREYQLSEAKLSSPVDAVVRSRLMEPGEMATPQRPVYTLAITHPKWVRAYVSEPQLGLIRPGQPATVLTDSHPGQHLRGTVGYLSSVAEFTPKTVQTEELRTSLVYEVRINVDDPDDKLRLGMPATVRLLRSEP